MKTSIIGRTGGIAAVALIAATGLAACGSSSDSATTNGQSSTMSSSSMPSSMSSMSSGSSMSGGMTGNAAAQTFGPGCSSIPASGSGSFDGMVKDPVATAASNNPLLSTLVKAVTQAGLVDTLNGASGLTVFAPTNAAFAKLPKATLAKVMANKAMLTKILTHHVIAGQLDPSSIDGMHATLAKDSVTVSGGTSGMTVDGAHVLCGNIPTANATVYVIDKVLMPQGM